MAMVMSNQLYDIGKWLVLVFMPAFAVFISGVGELYGWIDVGVVVATVNLVAVFLGSVLQVSSQKYHGGSGFGGENGCGGGTDERKCS